VLRNALIPIVTMSGIQFGYLLGGTVVVEQIFVLPGLGRLLLMSVTESDYAVAQGVTLVFALGFVTVNLLTDLLYTVVDPRLRS
jgi:peptide/nickel transport system permease protein